MRLETGVTPDRLRTLTHASRVLDEMLNEAPNRHAPYVGESAFATKAGIHASAIMKEPETYEHVPPESVGNERRILVSKQAGGRASTVALERARHRRRTRTIRASTRLLDEVKTREAAGLFLRGGGGLIRAAGSPALVERAALFSVDSFRVTVETSLQRARRSDQRVSKRYVEAVSSMATKSRWVGRRGQRSGQRTRQGAAQGSRPLQKHIEDVELVDYKVRILTRAERRR